MAGTRLHNAVRVDDAWLRETLDRAVTPVKGKEDENAPKGSSAACWRGVW